MAQTIIDTQKPVQEIPSRKTSGQESHKDVSDTGVPGTQAHAQDDKHTTQSTQKTSAYVFGDVISGAWIKRNFPGHEHSVIGGIVGLVVACLIFAVGIVRVLVILLCVALGVAAGQIADGNPKLMRIFRNFFRDKRI